MPLIRPPALVLAVLGLVALAASTAQARDDRPDCLPGTIFLDKVESFEGRGCVAVDDRGARVFDSRSRVVREGTWERLWPDGKRRSRCSYVAGVREGACFYWLRWGSRLGKIEFRGGRPHGVLERYSAKQRTILSMSYRDGVPDGPVVHTDDRGTVLMEGGFRRGLRHGEWSYFYPSGTLRMGGAFQADEPKGRWSCASQEALPGEIVFRRSLMALDLSDPGAWLQSSGRMVAPGRCSVDDPVARCAEAEGPTRLETCRQAVDADRDNAAAWTALAEAETAQRRYGPAAAAWRHAADAALAANEIPGGVVALAKAGSMALEGNWSSWAGELLTAALELDPDVGTRLDWFAGALDRADRPALGRISGSQGSGFLVADSLHVVTNHHVVGSCTTVTVRQGENEVRGTVVHSDKELDLAAIELDSELGQPLPLRAGADLLVGERVAVMGYPLAGILGDSEARLTEGIVNATRGPQGEDRLLQMSAQIAPGNSGGPVLDGGGAVIGVVVSTLNARAVLRRSGALAQNVNFAIRAPILAGFLDASKLDWKRVRRSPAKGLTGVAARARQGTVVVRCMAGETPPP